LYFDQTPYNSRNWNTEETSGKLMNPFEMQTLLSLWLVIKSESNFPSFLGDVAKHYIHFPFLYNHLFPRRLGCRAKGLVFHHKNSSAQCQDRQGLGRWDGSRGRVDPDSQNLAAFARLLHVCRLNFWGAILKRWALLHVTSFPFKETDLVDIRYYLPIVG
jgi:hypothetical protein